MNEIATTSSGQGFDLSPRNFEQALQFAEYLAGSEMVPKQFRGKPGDCLIAMQWGYEVNLKPLQALQNIGVINGKPGIYGDAGKAILLAAGCVIDEDDTEIVKRNGRSRCRIVRPGRPPVERTFSLEDAKTAGLWNKEGPWRTYPFRQMAWRAFWFAARDAASDLLRGMAGIEELIDHPSGAVAEPPPPPAPPALEAYPAEKFDANLQAWADVIASGRKTPDALIAMLSTKAALSDEQKDRIRGLAQPAEAVEVEGSSE